MMSARQPRVLVIEDEFLIADTLQQTLETLGYEVIGPIASRSEALDYCRSCDADAAIMNLIIGGKTVYDLAEILAERRIPFVFASGLDRVSLDPAWSGRPFLAKPYSEKAVRDQLRLLLPDREAHTLQQIGGREL